ncbi:MAG TPA: peptidoglycan DD-metalloendopeptidase family protein [Gemmatimonadaceae bacterium]
MRARLLSLSIIAAAAAAFGCDSTSPGGAADPCQVLKEPGSPNATFSSAGVFTVSPIAVGSISSIIPLGNLNPPNHVYPTDHIYIIPVNAATGANAVSAAAAGTVLELYQPDASDWKVLIKVDKSFYYYYDHITPISGLSIGQSVTAGQVIGTNAGQGAAAIDFGVYNFNNAPVSGILNTCALKAESFVDAPLKYYSGTLQTSLYGKVNTANNVSKDGKFDYDQAGKLTGNWILSGHQPGASTQYALAFVYNVVDRSMRVSAGSLLGGGGTFGVQAALNDWSFFNTGSGQVNIRLYPTSQGDQGAPSTTQFGVLAVQMVSANQIKVEMFVGNTTGNAAFTANAQLYER